MRIVTVAPHMKLTLAQMEVILQLLEGQGQVLSLWGAGYSSLERIATSHFGLIMNSPTELGYRLPYPIVEE
jgi:hypothetical protein